MEKSRGSCQDGCGVLRFKEEGKVGAEKKDMRNYREALLHLSICKATRDLSADLFAFAVLI